MLVKPTVFQYEIWFRIYPASTVPSAFGTTNCPKKCGVGICDLRAPTRPTEVTWRAPAQRPGPGWEWGRETALSEKQEHAEPLQAWAALHSPCPVGLPAAQVE
jgi:hypothetical protein